jgi:hypothetical protein
MLEETLVGVIIVSFGTCGGSSLADSENTGEF